MSVLSVAGVEALKTRAQADVDSGVLPSCQYALALDGEVVVAETLGDAPSDARYAIWSTTKPVFASVVWQLMGEGLLDLTRPVADLWPEFGAHGKDRVTLEHLLLFTAGFPTPVLDPSVIGDRDRCVKQMEQWTLEFEPGTEWAYHGVSAHWVMAELVNRVDGGDHRRSLRERVLDPLGLDRLELGVPVGKQEGIRLVRKGGSPAKPEEVAAYLGLPELPAEIAEMIANAAAGATATPGTGLDIYELPEVRAAGVPGAGGVSDASSLAMFYQELLHNRAGVWDAAILADATGNVRNTMAGSLLNILAMRTVGLEVQGDDPTAKFRPGCGHASPRTFGHGGAGGQISWADPESGLSFAYLTDGDDVNAIRQNLRVQELAAAAVACLA